MIQMQCQEKAMIMDEIPRTNHYGQPEKEVKLNKNILVAYNN